MINEKNDNKEKKVANSFYNFDLLFIYFYSF